MHLTLPSRPGDPAWELAMLYPPQGEWTEAEYLALDGSHLIEFSQGALEFLPMPTPLHQRIVRLLFELLNAYVVANRLGEVFFAPLPVHLWAGQVPRTRYFLCPAWPNPGSRQACRRR